MKLITENDSLLGMEARVEACAAEVVRLVQLTVERIRSKKEFQANHRIVSNTTKATNHPFGNNNAKDSWRTVKLYEDRFIDNDGVDIERVVRQCATTFGCTTASQEEEADRPDVRNNDSLDGERSRMVKNVIWPLLSCLTQCYTFLDALPQETPPTPARAKRKPSPPRGLLSIQQYTDIAALMEILSCWSILPQLQSNVLESVEDRVTYRLPQSLAGRIPRASLRWGAATLEGRDSSTSTALPKVLRELKQTLTTLGQVVLLDRFRPMLLPRHLPDLHAALFQTEALERHDWNSTVPQQETSVPKGYHDVVSALLPTSENPIVNSEYYRPVEPLLLAKSFQTLLHRGTQAPPWLRRRVSGLLMGMACHDLAAVVQVFVQMTPVSDRTGASIRLARALTTGKDNDDAYYALLCPELISLLDVHQLDSTNNVSQQAGLLTVWAVLSQLPMGTLVCHVVPLLSDSLMDKEQTLSKTVRRLMTLLSSYQSSIMSAWSLCRLFLTPRATPHSLAGTKVTLLGQLLRLASLSSPVMNCPVKQDATTVLRLLCSNLSKASFSTNDEFVDGNDLLAMALLYSVQPSFLDREGYEYVVASEAGGEDRGSWTCAWTKRVDNGEAHQESVTMDHMEKIGTRVGVVVQELLVPLSDGAEKGLELESVEESISRLPSRVFHLLLLCFFSSKSPHREVSAPRIELPLAYREQDKEFQLGVMLMLPRLCEECSVGSLLLAGSGGTGILTTIQLVLDCAVSIVSDADAIGISDGIAPTPYPRESEDAIQTSPFHSCDKLFRQYLGIKSVSERPVPGTKDNFQIDTVLSTSSLVVGLVIAMLELGSERRPENEETALQSMLPSLSILTEYKSVVRIGDEHSISKVQAELAEMTAYAIALIAARPAMEKKATSTAPVQRSEEETLKEAIALAENDLESAQPPIRARGLLSLRRLAQRYTRDKDEARHDQPLIVEVVARDSMESSMTLYERAAVEIVRVATSALVDTESYVYLAGIQSIVAAADVSPRAVVPMLGEAVCAGTMRWQGRTSAMETTLSDSQRIKVTEALLFVIRRRGRAVDKFTSLLLNLMLYGRNKIEEEPAQEGMEERILHRTHKYFLSGLTATDRDLHEDQDAMQKEKALRLRTGGPVFEEEEKSILRSACITVVSELVSSSEVLLLVNACPSLVRLVKNALALEFSRPVRRAGALLCGELYEAVLREYEETAESQHVQGTHHPKKCFAVEMVASHEESLPPILQLYSARVEAVNCDSRRSRLYDPATASRCQEALAAREKAENLGILAAARLRLRSMQEDSRNPIAKAVKARLSEDRENEKGVIGGFRWIP